MVPGAYMVYAFPNGFDNPGNITARGKGEFRFYLIEALYDQGVGKVNSACLNLHQHFMLFWFQVRHGFQNKIGRRPVSITANCSHVFLVFEHFEYQFPHFIARE